LNPAAKNGNVVHDNKKPEMGRGHRSPAKTRTRIIVKARPGSNPDPGKKLGRSTRSSGRLALRSSGKTVKAMKKREIIHSSIA